MGWRFEERELLRRKRNVNLLLLLLQKKLVKQRTLNPQRHRKEELLKRFKIWVCKKILSNLLETRVLYKSIWVLSYLHCQVWLTMGTMQQQIASSFFRTNMSHTACLRLRGLRLPRSMRAPV